MVAAQSPIDLHGDLAFGSVEMPFGTAADAGKQYALSLKAFAPLTQMICTEAIAVIDGPEIIELTEAHRADVLALTALVYPHYFRPHTMDLGRYFGIYQSDRLAAIIGERLGTDAFQEMSAICTHPDFNGRNYARRLTAMLTNDTLTPAAARRCCA